MHKITQKRNNKFHFSPLRYPGGKTFLYGYIEQCLKKLEIKNVKYVEPYAGGAGAAITLLLLEKVDRIVINDLDRGIYSFWKSAIFHTEKFIKKIETTPISIAEWKRQKKIYKRKNSSEFNLGFATFFLNRTNVSGIIGGGPIGGIKQTGKWKLSARFNKDKLIEKIRTLGEYRSRIEVYNLDGLKLLEKFLHKPNTFIYLDPPYFDKGDLLYLNHYAFSDHLQLSRKLNKNLNAAWILTYDNSTEIKALYAERMKFDFRIKHHAHTAHSGKEVMILSNALAA